MRPYLDSGVNDSSVAVSFLGNDSRAENDIAYCIIFEVSDLCLWSTINDSALRLVSMLNLNLPAAVSKTKSERLQLLCGITLAVQPENYYEKPICACRCLRPISDCIRSIRMVRIYLQVDENTVSIISVYLTAILTR